MVLSGRIETNDIYGVGATLGNSWREQELILSYFSEVKKNIDADYKILLQR